MAIKASRANTVRGPWDELRQGLFPWIDDNIGELEREVYKDRSAAERSFSHLLESHGGKTVRVRAPANVALHLLLGAIVVAVEQMLRMLC